MTRPLFVVVPEKGRVRRLVLLDYAALLDTGLLAGEGAEVVQFCAANLTVLVDSDRVNERRFDGEDALNADVVAHLTHGEALFGAFARNADNDTAILLDTLFVTLFDAVSYGDGVAGAEFRMLLARGECLFGNLD